jgi:hypothetical protein
VSGVNATPQTPGKALESGVEDSDFIPDAMYWASELGVGEIGGADWAQV